MNITYAYSVIITCPLCRIYCGSADKCNSRYELLIFEECFHTPMYEKVEEFKLKTLAFLHFRALIIVTSDILIRWN